MEHQVCLLIVHTVLPKNDDHCKWTCEFDYVEHHQVSLWFLHLADRMCTLPVHLSCLTHHQHAFLPLPDQQAITLHETEIVPKGNHMRMPEVLILQRRDGSLWMWSVGLISNLLPPLVDPMWIPNLNNNPRINHFMPSIIICRQILIHCHKLHHPITISQESSHNGLDLSLDTFSKSCKAQTGISQRTLIDSAMFPWPATWQCTNLLICSWKWWTWCCAAVGIAMAENGTPQELCVQILPDRAAKQMLTWGSIAATVHSSSGSKPNIQPSKSTTCPSSTYLWTSSSKNSSTQKFAVFKANRHNMHSYCVRWAFWKQQLIPSEVPPPQPILKDLLYHHILHLQTMTSKCPHYLLTHIPID